jgi:protocatechuate 3,4-dioxygenase beta subunit
MKRFLILTLMGVAACAPVPVQGTVTPLSPSETPVSSPTDAPAAPTESALASPDVFSALPAPACNGMLTPANTEGPYYTPNTPEKTSLLEEGMQGERLVLIGYVLDVNCNPVPNAWLDFWQADNNGNYDNAGYTLRGHQYTDAQGRYYLETILPGLYSSRPIRHIHVKVQAPNGEVLTSQLYFPEQPVENLTVQLVPQDDFQLGFFNFVIE